MKNVSQKRYQDKQDKDNREAVNVAAIVKVIAFDPVSMKVDVQPVSKRLENGGYISPPPILGLPVTSTKSGGFIIRPWVKPGDIGVIIYIDHDIDNAVATGKESEPNTERNHSTSDAVFVGGIITGNAPAQGLTGNAVVITSEDGSTALEITPNSIKIKAENIELEAGSNIKLTAPAINLN